MHFKLLAYTLVSALWIEAAPTHRGHKRVGHRYIARYRGWVAMFSAQASTSIIALFDVLPAAVERNILIALERAAHRRAASRVIPENLHPEYIQQVFATPLKSLEIPQELRWEDYVKAGYCGVPEELIPVDLLVTGSGLSSSAAMVVASTLAFLAITGKLEGAERVEKGTLVKMSMENEKRVAASMLSVSSSVLYITFYPALTASPTSLPSTSPFPEPPGAILVCAHSLVVADNCNCNLRVVETLSSAPRRLRPRTLPPPLTRRAREKKITLHRVVGRLGALDALKPPKPTEFGATLAEMVELSGLEAGALHEVEGVFIRPTDTIYEGLMYVHTGSGRDTLQATQACKARPLRRLARAAALPAVRQLGALTNDSQTSSAADFESSCEELDLLTRLAREAWAYGSRLTGAGWGGCTVLLVPEREVVDLMQKLSAAYVPYPDLDHEWSVNRYVENAEPWTFLFLGDRKRT
ncbi:Galactokinase [Mycena filopes]|nr:Galactokinase [Mycena filopes]